MKKIYLNEDKCGNPCTEFKTACQKCLMEYYKWKERHPESLEDRKEKVNKWLTKIIEKL